MGRGSHATGWCGVTLTASVAILQPYMQLYVCLQVAINRSRMATVMEAVLEDLPRQRAAAQQRAEWEDQIRNYIQVHTA